LSRGNFYSKNLNLFDSFSAIFPFKEELFEEMKKNEKIIEKITK